MPKTKQKAVAAGPLLTCTPKALPRAKWVEAAKVATRINPMNHPRLERLVKVDPTVKITAEKIAVVTAKIWHTGGVKLGVAFLDNPPLALKKRILEHMNAWAKTANVKFVLSTSNAQVRIDRHGGPDGGYWSYLGTDILSIAKGEATMDLQAFTMSTPESEFHRVVRHETGHTMGFPHEHMRRELVQKIDPAKAIAFYGAPPGWSPDEVRAQVLTTIEESSLLGTPHTDPHSIMCYQIPGTITKDGQPIIGGTDIDKIDYKFAAQIYPKPKK